MEIIYKKVEEIIPYENNPRNNEEAVEYVANSIKEFGFKVPIIIDENNVVVCGHTRLKASVLLKLKEVPCIIASDLNDEELKAFRLVDNKVSEKSSWNYELLDEELAKILDIDMSKFNFVKIDEININDVDLDEYFTDESNEKEISCPYCSYTGKVGEFDENN